LRSQRTGIARELCDRPWTVPHVAVGVLFGYTTLAGLLNCTIIEVTSEILTTRHGPVPISGCCKPKLPINEVQQLYCVQDFETSRRGRRSVTYSVNALTRDLHKVPLVNGLDNRDHAVFIEQLIERWLKIEDQPVEAEIEP
jgi:hypothetical protein